MSGAVVDLTDGEFEEKVLKNSTPTLIDFWAEWCGPCRAMTPIIEELAANFSGKVQIAKMNIDDNPQTPSNYAVRAIPTILLFKDGAVAEQVVGAQTKSKLEDLLNKHVA